MAARIKFLFFYFLSWTGLFLLARLAFLLYYFEQTRTLGTGTSFLVFWHGLRMDLAMSAYIALPVCVFLLASIFIRFFARSVVYRIYTYILLFLFLLITIADLQVYANWGFRIDATPLRYLSSPKEAWASVSHLPLLLYLFLFLVFYLGLCWLFNRIIRRLAAGMHPSQHPVVSALVWLVITAALIIPMRGGLQLVPLTQSSVYFSTSNFANVAAINASWNFLDGLWRSKGTKNPYPYLDTKEAHAVVDSLYAASGNTVPVLRTNRPNVLLVIWESFTEKATHAVVEGKEVTPHFNELKGQGLYFSHAYASGDRTDKGLAAVLAGYPALNNFSIIRDPGKTAKMPTLGGFFKDASYHTAFYYGGESEFANIKSFVLQGRYDHLVEEKDFNKADLNSKWGAHDGVVASRILSDLGRTAAPFFTTWMTLSSHEPFEVPVPPVFQGKDITSKFLNSLHYTDQVLYDFVQQCSRQPWWDNTLMIIVADHGHPLPEPSTTLDNFKVPMLWLGGALKEHGVVNDHIVSQLDLATTLTRQLDPRSRLFPFSKDLFDPATRQWAYFSYHYGFGFVQPASAYAFDNVGKQFSQQQGQPKPADLRAGKAMQQITYGDYLDR